MIRKIWKHVTDWAEGYLWVPLILLGIWGSDVLVQIATNRPVKYNVDWLIDYSGTAYKCVLIILFLSVLKQAEGSWLTKEDKLAHPINHAISAAGTVLCFYGLIYVFTH